MRLTIVFAFVLTIMGITYALTKVTVSNTSVINAGQNMFITQPSLTNPVTCPSDSSPSYIQNPTPISWNLTAGAAGQIYYLCIDNQGPVTDAVSITAGPATSITTGACPSTGSTLVMQTPIVGAPSSLAGHTATTTPVNIQVCAGSSMAPAPTGPTFTITVQ